jgi:uncharacterized protein YjeT (DUF2065 family)
MTTSELLLPALALMLVIEGLFPLLAPAAWRDAFTRMTQMRDGQIRFMGLVSMLAGLILMSLIR